MSEIEINEQLIQRAREEAFKHTIVVLNRETIVAIAKVFLSAVCDGKQKLAGEAGRGGLWSYDKLRYPQDDGSIAQYVDGHLYEGRTDFGYPRHFNFIALRPEEEKREKTS